MRQQFRARQRRNRHGPGVDPVGRAELRRFQLLERKPVKNHRDHEQVQHESKQKQRRERKEGDFLVPRHMIDEDTAEDHDGLRAHGGDQPRAVNAFFQRRLGFVGEHEVEYAPQNHDPQDAPYPEQRLAHSRIFAEQHKLVAQNAYARHHRQEARPRAVAPEILDEPFRKHEQPYDVQDRQPHAQRRVEPKQQTCADGIIQQVQGHGHDARGHDHCEVGGGLRFQHGQKTPADSVLKVRHTASDRSGTDAARM